MIAATAAAGAAGTPRRSRRFMVLAWAFALFNAARLFGYLPTLWAIHVSGDSSQHSLWTWATWLGANLTMACWVTERNGRFDAAAAVSAGNATMCLAIVVQIICTRL